VHEGPAIEELIAEEPEGAPTAAERAEAADDSVPAEPEPAAEPDWRADADAALREQ
jgi:hypothetical protein